MTARTFEFVFTIDIVWTIPYHAPKYIIHGSWNLNTVRSVSASPVSTGCRLERQKFSVWPHAIDLYGVPVRNCTLPTELTLGRCVGRCKDDRPSLEYDPGTGVFQEVSSCKCCRGPRNLILAKISCEGSTFDMKFIDYQSCSCHECTGQLRVCFHRRCQRRRHHRRRLCHSPVHPRQSLRS